MEVVTRREQALALFHLIGKILYNKSASSVMSKAQSSTYNLAGKGDPPSSSASAKDKLRDQELDRRLRNPPPLPAWLSDHHRQTSRVDIDVKILSIIHVVYLLISLIRLFTQTLLSIRAFSPSIFTKTTLSSATSLKNAKVFAIGSVGLMLAEANRLVIFSTLQSAESSIVESKWYKTNPHQFHLLTLGTLHSLPSPVPRRGQKMYKPAFFDALKTQRIAEDAVADTRGWLAEYGSEYEYGHEDEVVSGSTRNRNYTQNEVVQEMGAVLRALSRRVAKSDSLQPTPALRPPPSSHLAFSCLNFSRSGGLGAEKVLDDNDIVDNETEAIDNRRGGAEGYERKRKQAEVESTEEMAVGSWLDNDDIEDFS